MHASATTPHLSREVFGFALASSLSDPSVGYPSWNFDLLSTVAFFGLHVSTSGGFVGDSEWNVWNSPALTSLVTVAHQHGTKVLLGIDLQDFSGGNATMCAGLERYGTTVASTVAQVVAKHVDGVNIDYEGLDGSCGTADSSYEQHTMDSFVRAMRSALGPRPYLSVDTYAGAAADPYGFFDVAGIGRYADSMFVMAYDLEYSNYHYSPPGCSSFCLGPTAPASGYRYNDTAVLQQYEQLVSPGRLILGVPYYGRKACVGSPTANAYPTSSVVADTYLDAAGEAAYYEVRPGTYVVHRDAHSSGDERWDTWYNTTLSCTRELYWDDATSLGVKYDLVNSMQIRGVGIWNLNYGGGAPELWSELSSHFGRCAAATIAASPVSPSGTGAQVSITAGASGCTDPQYRFWVQAPGGAWSVVRDWGSSAAYTWTATGAAGVYHLEADARAATSGGYDAVANLTYSLKACTGASLSPDVASPQRPGTTITFTGSATCAGTPEYRFWVRPPGGAWGIVRDYGAGASYGWNTTGMRLGAYEVEVDVRDHGATAAYESVADIAYTLDPPCAKPTLSTSPASPQGPGALVTLSAATASCPSPLYRFWIFTPGSRWSMVRNYSTTATYPWKTAGYPAGTYSLEVDVRDASSQVAYDAVTVVGDVLQTCSAARLSPNLASPQRVGTSIVITGGATCGGRPQYRFWVRAPGGRWTIAQDYGASATFTWSTAGRRAGTYSLEVDVRDVGSTAAYEAVANATFLLS